MHAKFERPSFLDQQSSKNSTASTFHQSNYNTQRNQRSLRKKREQSETKYSSTKDKTFRIKKSSLSPNRRGMYWQNWLLPEDMRKPTPSNYPETGSSSVCAIFSDTNDILYSRNCQQERQIASLTKIMTAFTVINICNTYGIKPRQTWVNIQKQASMMEGTSANLKNGDELLIIDLLYGLMLPSGNDAAIALAQYLGKFLSYIFTHQSTLTCKQQQGLQNFESKKQFYNLEYKEESIKLFVFEMNQNCHKIGLKQTHFSNPTGLTDPDSYSTAFQMSQLISFCMRNVLLRAIFKKKNYICEAKNSKLATVRQIEWKNTNRHLFQIRDCIGVKTGITPGAGPCLSTAYRVLGRELIVVVLNSKTLQDRYVDSQIVYKYAQAKLQHQQHQQN